MSSQMKVTEESTEQENDIQIFKISMGLTGLNAVHFSFRRTVLTFTVSRASRALLLFAPGLASTFDMIIFQPHFSCRRSPSGLK